MKNNKVNGAIHAFMFCAFFISFLCNTDPYLSRDMVSVSYSFFATCLSSELLTFAGCMVFCIYLAAIWRLKLKLRLLLVLLLNIAGIVVLFSGFVFIAFVLVTAALCTALPLAVNYEKLEPTRIFFAFAACIITFCFPNFGYLAGIVALITVIAQSEIYGIRFGGRFILAFMMLTAFLFGAFPAENTKKVPEVSPDQFRQNYEMMMIAFAQHGSVPDKSLCFFNHPWQNMPDLAAIVIRLSVDKNENMNAYFAGDQLRYAAEYELALKGKRIPPLPPKNPQYYLRPSVVLISYPAVCDYAWRNNAVHIPYYGDSWRNYTFYTVEGISNLKQKMAPGGVLAVQLPDDYENAAPILAAVKKVFKHTRIFRWSGVYLLASNRKLTDDPEILDRNAIEGGIYKYMYAPYRILLFALSIFQDDTDDARLMQTADNVSPLSVHDLPRLKNAGQSCLIYADLIFRAICKNTFWLLPLMLLLYYFCRYWFAGVPGAKLPFQSFETGLISGLTFLLPVFSYSLMNSIPLVNLITGKLMALVCIAAMIVFLFISSKAADAFFVRILMIVLCACAFFYNDFSKTLLCCIALLAGIATVSSGHCPRKCSCSAWLLGMAAAFCVTPVLWFADSWMRSLTAGIIMGYILFAEYRKTIVE